MPYFAGVPRFARLGNRLHMHSFVCVFSAVAYVSRVMPLRGGSLGKCPLR